MCVLAGIAVYTLSLTMVNSLNSVVPTTISTAANSTTYLNSQTKSTNKFELIHADRESLKRADVRGVLRVSRDTIEEIFVFILQALSEKHVSPGFGQRVVVYFCRWIASHGTAVARRDRRRTIC
jgi:recyclin-1